MALDKCVLRRGDGERTVGSNHTRVSLRMVCFSLCLVVKCKTSSFSIDTMCVRCQVDVMMCSLFNVE